MAVFVNDSTSGSAVRYTLPAPRNLDAVTAQVRAELEQPTTGFVRFPVLRDDGSLVDLIARADALTFEVQTIDEL
jgi:hypothetical protein